MPDYVTDLFIMCVVSAALLFNFVALNDTTPKNAISHRIAKHAKSLWLIPWAWGVLAGHFFFRGPGVFSGAFGYVVLGAISFVVTLLGLVLRGKWVGGRLTHAMILVAGAITGWATWSMQ